MNGKSMFIVIISIIMILFYVYYVCYVMCIYVYIYIYNTNNSNINDNGPRNGKHNFRNGVVAKTAKRKAGSIIKRA